MDSFEIILCVWWRLIEYVDVLVLIIRYFYFMVLLLFFGDWLSGSFLMCFFFEKFSSSRRVAWLLKECLFRFWFNNLTVIVEIAKFLLIQYSAINPRSNVGAMRLYDFRILINFHMLCTFHNESQLFRMKFRWSLRERMQDSSWWLMPRIWFPGIDPTFNFKNILRGLFGFFKILPDWWSRSMAALAISRNMGRAHIRYWFVQTIMWTLYFHVCVCVTAFVIILIFIELLRIIVNLRLFTLFLTSVINLDVLSWYFLIWRINAILGDLLTAKFNMVPRILKFILE